VPLLPYSREVARPKWLKKSVAVYRLAFGQPRQWSAPIEWPTLIVSA